MNVSAIIDVGYDFDFVLVVDLRYNFGFVNLGGFKDELEKEFQINIGGVTLAMVHCFFLWLTSLISDSRFFRAIQKVGKGLS